MPPARPPTRSGNLSIQDVLQLAIDAGMSPFGSKPKTPGEAIEAVAVAYAENSSFDPDATNANSNRSVDVGLWMINSIHGYSATWLKDPRHNAQAMVKVYNQAGRSWSPWVAYGTSRYETGLRLATQAARRKGISVGKIGPYGAVGGYNVPGSEALASGVGATGKAVDEALDNAFGWVQELLDGMWPLLLKGALATTGLALIGYGVSQLAGSTKAAEHTKQAAGLATGAAAR